MTAPTILCRLDEIPEPGGKGVLLPRDGGRPLDLVVVRFRGTLRAYVNSCPHVGTPLDMLPDRFFTRDGSELLCSTHGARFDPATGLCVAGPCAGARLREVAVRLEGASVVLADAVS